MNHHAGRLIDRNDLGVLIEDTQRKILREGVERSQLGRLDVDDFAAAQAEGGAPGAAVHAHAAGLDPVLQARAAVGAELLLQENVEPFAGVAGGSIQNQSS